jgi:hypothetical protein
VTRSGNGDGRPVNRPGRVLAAGTAVALAAAAIGIRAADGAALRTGDLSAGYGFGLAALFALAVSTVGAKYRAHVALTDAGSNPVDRLRTATIAILFTSAAAVPLALILLHRSPSTQTPDATAPPNGVSLTITPTPVVPAPTRQPRPHGGWPHFNFGALLLIIAAVMFIAALAALAVLIIRLLRGAEPAAEVSANPPAAPPTDDEALADALDAGRCALDGDDARDAIIACYAAMEVSLSNAGAARRLADSPADLLQRAVRHDLLREGPSSDLTALFREARYSTHPMGADHLAAAHRALDAVTADLAAHTARRGAAR